jgi:hypothetical protein
MKSSPVHEPTLIHVESLDDSHSKPQYPPCDPQQSFALLIPQLEHVDVGGQLQPTLW